MIKTSEIAPLKRKDRKSLIMSKVTNFKKGTKNPDEKIENAKAICKVLNTFVKSYIEENVEKDRNLGELSVLNNDNLVKSIDKKLAEFKLLSIDLMRKKARTKEEIEFSPQNIYEISGATQLAFANSVTRSLSTKLGTLLEDMAFISPYVLDPDKDFGIKIKGVDLIVLNYKNQKLEYVQLKTQRNTLTGSQSGRSEKELEIHDNPVFCTCLDIGSWTFNSSKIDKASGEDFWSRIGIPYENILLPKLKIFISQLEEEFAKFILK